MSFINKTDSFEIFAGKLVLTKMLLKPKFLLNHVFIPLPNQKTCCRRSGAKDQITAKIKVGPELKPYTTCPLSAIGYSTEDLWAPAEWPNMNPVVSNRSVLKQLHLLGPQLEPPSSAKCDPRTL